MAGVDTRELQIVLTARDEATKQLQGLNKQMGALGGNASKLRGLFNNFGTSLANTGRSFLSLQGAIAGVGLGLLVADVAKAGANLERMEAVTKVLSKNLGIGADQLKEYRDALAEVNTFGGSATETINTFLQSGLAGTIDFKKFIQVTKDFSASAGVSSKEGIESFTKAIVSLRPELLETFGIQFNLTQVNKEFAKTLGKSSSELTATERRQALLNEVFKQGEAVTGVYAETYKTAGKNLLSIKDAMQNVKEYLGSALTPALKEFTGTLLANLKGSIQWFENNRDAVTEFGEKLAKVAVVAVKGIGKFFRFLIKNKEIVIGLFGAIAISIGVAVASMLPALLSAHGAFLILWGVITLLQKSGIIKWFMGLGGVAQILVGSLVGLPAIGLALSAIIPSIVGGFTALAGVIGTVGTVVTGTLLPAIGSILVAIAPIAIPILAIVAVLGLFYLAWKNNFLGIQEVVAEFVENFKQGVQWWIEAFQSVVTWINENIMPLFSLSLPELLGVFLGFVVGFAINLYNAFVENLQALPEYLMTIGTNAKDNFVAQLKAMYELGIVWIKKTDTYLRETWDALPEYTKTIWEQVSTTVVDQLKATWELGGVYVDKILGWFDDMNKKAKDAIVSFKEAFKVGREGAPSFQFGGFVPQTGTALLHKGEFVLSRNMLEGRVQAPSSIQEVFNQPININANISNEIDLDLLGDRLAFALRNSR